MTFQAREHHRSRVPELIDPRAGKTVGVNQSPDATATAQNTAPGDSPNNAKDENDGTWWSYASSGGSTGASWLQFEFPTARKIEVCVIENKSGAYNINVASIMYIEYYDGADWQVVVTVPSGSSKYGTWGWAQPTAVTKYRLRWTGIVGYGRITEWKTYL